MRAGVPSHLHDAEAGPAAEERVLHERALAALGRAPRALACRRARRARIQPRHRAQLRVLRPGGWAGSGSVLHQPSVSGESSDAHPPPKISCCMEPCASRWAGPELLRAQDTHGCKHTRHARHLLLRPPPRTGSSPRTSGRCGVTGPGLRHRPQSTVPQSAGNVLGSGSVKTPCVVACARRCPCVYRTASTFEQLFAQRTARRVQGPTSRRGPARAIYVPSALAHKCSTSNPSSGVGCKMRAPGEALTSPTHGGVPVTAPCYNPAQAQRLDSLMNKLYV